MKSRYRFATCCIGLRLGIFLGGTDIGQVNTGYGRGGWEKGFGDQIEICTYRGAWRMEAA